MESRDGKLGRAYAKVINDFSSTSIRPIFTEHIDREANVITDGWSAYKAFRVDYRNLIQIPFNKGRNFQMLHIQIRNFKNWLRPMRYFKHKKK